MQRHLGLAVVVCLTLIGPSPVQAQGRGWEFEVTPYLWVAGFSGDFGIAGAPPASVDLSFSDLVENLSIGGMLAVEAGTGRWRMLFDGVYMKLSGDGDTPGPFFSGVDVETEMGLLQAALGYRVVDQQGVAFDVLAGARAWIIESDLEFNAGVLPKQAFNDDKAWVDPIVGLRGRFSLTRNLVLTFLGDIGGFGLVSHFTWQAWAGVVYHLSDRWALKAGYRALGVDYSDDGFVFDTVIQGPIVGVSLRF